jgi:hypothetical protein
MKIIRNAIAVGLIAVASAANPNPVAQNGNVASTGKVALSWQVAMGINVTDLKYTITGSGTTAGNNYGPLDANIGDAMSAEWVAGGITAGCGYTLSVSGTDSNSDPCSGTTGTFCVIPGQTTYEQVSVVCLEPTDGQVSADVNTGSVAVEAGITAQPVAPYACPGITSFSIVPAELLSTQPAMVSIQTTGTVSAISWTASGCNAVNGPGTGTVTGFTSPSAASTTFSCGSCAGQVTVQAQVLYDQVQPGSDASTNVCAGAQFTTFTGLINCEGGGALTCFAPTVACNGACTNPNTDSNNCGTCNNKCAAPTTCNSGVCNCGSTETLSDGICCPNATPTSCNCGTCGNACNVAGGFTSNGGTCSPPPPVPCTGFSAGANTPAGCVKCTGSTNGVCSGTESVFVTKDIKAKLLNGTGGTSGQLTAASCYACLLKNQCIDDDVGDVGQECEDVSTSSANGPTGCTAVVNCTIGNSPSLSGTNCATSNPDSACYCGSAVGTACNTPGNANGPCEASEAAGLGFATSDPTDIILNYTNTALPAGQANTIFACAFSNHCAACLN